MSWNKLSDKDYEKLTLVEAFERARKGVGVLIIRKVFNPRGPKPAIEFYSWKDD